MLLLIDGFPILSADGGEIKHDVVPMFDVEKIEVLKGAGSALYGSSALGGVVNVITAKPRSNDLRLRMFSGFYDKTKYAEWNWWGTSPRWFNAAYGRIQRVYGSSSFRVSGGVYGNQGYRKMDDFLRWNVTASGWLKLAKDHRLHVSANVASNHRGNWIFWRSLKHPLVPPENADLSERVVSEKQYVYAKHSWLVNSFFSMENRLYLYHTSNDTKSDTSDFSLRPADRVQSSAYVAGYQWQGIYSGIKGHLLTGGMDASFSYVDAQTFGRRTATSWALYLQDEVSLFSGMRLTVGARGDYTKVDIAKVDGRINPRLGMAYDIAPGSTMRASVGLGFRSPSIAERFAVAGAAGLQTKPNPDLLPERSTSYEIGFRQVIFPFAVVDVALFRNDYRDLVEPIID
ncbi:MAG: TonB-dependent receptor, partial [Chlorobi bacterium]|nr:TonB-dependent receptor [Chlorobiota bacterium]